MADKRITELQLIDSVSGGVNIPGDDGIQTYRMTAEQLKTYIQTDFPAAGGVTRAMLAEGAKGRETVAGQQSSGFTASVDTDFYPLTSSSFTVTLPAAASGNKGRKIFFVHQGTGAGTFGQTYTIGALTALHTFGESVEIQSDGTNWFVRSRYIPQNKFAFTPPSSQGFGTITAVELHAWRQGQFLALQGRFTAGTSTASEARLGLPTNLSSPTFSQGIRHCGVFFKSGVQTVHGGAVLIESAVGYITFSVNDIIGAGNFDPLVKGNGNAVINSATSGSINAMIPIDGWNG